MNKVIYYEVEIDYELEHENGSLFWHDESVCGTDKENARFTIAEMLDVIHKKFVDGWTIKVSKITISPVYNEQVYNSLDEFEKVYGKVQDGQ